MKKPGLYNALDKVAKLSKHKTGTRGIDQNRKKEEEKNECFFGRESPRMGI
jgi:hypothetical protein